MKKHILLTALTLFFFVASQAQSKQAHLKSSVSHVKTDTVSGTATVNQSLQIQGYYPTIAIQPVVTKVSGTAAGAVRLYGSLDGVNYVRINPTDSLLVTNVSTPQTKIFTITGSPYEFYRAAYTGVGTMVAKIVTLATWKK